MTDREAKSRAVKILAKSIYRDLEAQGFDEKQIVALATELISEVRRTRHRAHLRSDVQDLARQRQVAARLTQSVVTCSRPLSLADLRSLI
jgi:hypothetical protein